MRDEYVIMGGDTVIQEGDEVSLLRPTNKTPNFWMPAKYVGHPFRGMYGTDYILRRKLESN